MKRLTLMAFEMMRLTRILRTWYLPGVAAVIALAVLFAGSRGNATTPVEAAEEWHLSWYKHEPTGHYGAWTEKYLYRYEAKKVAEALGGRLRLACCFPLCDTLCYLQGWYVEVEHTPMELSVVVNAEFSGTIAVVGSKFSSGTPVKLEINNKYIDLAQANEGRST